MKKKIYNRAKKSEKQFESKKMQVLWEYKLATGLEAVFGYLYLEKNI